MVSNWHDGPNVESHFLPVDSDDTKSYQSEMGQNSSQCWCTDVKHDQTHGVEWRHYGAKT